MVTILFIDFGVIVKYFISDNFTKYIILLLKLCVNVL